jgi:hypothetical protein
LHLLFNTENTFLYFEWQWKPQNFSVSCKTLFLMSVVMTSFFNLLCNIVEIDWLTKQRQMIFEGFQSFCFVLKTIIKEIKLYYFNLYFVYQDLAKTMAGFLLTWHRSSRASGPAETETPESRSRFRSGKSCSATPATRSKTAKAATTSITRRLHSPSAKMILKFFVR